MAHSERLCECGPCDFFIGSDGIHSVFTGITAMSGKHSRTRRSGSSQRGLARNRPTPPSNSAALIIFAKAPIEGYVKTRLCPPLTPDEAASLHGSLVLDVLDRCQSLRGIDCILAGAPTREHPFFAAMKTRFTIPVWDQVGEYLGARMAHAFHSALGSPYQSAIIIGTDADFRACIDGKKDL